MIQIYETIGGTRTLVGETMMDEAAWFDFGRFRKSLYQPGQIVKPKWANASPKAQEQNHPIELIRQTFFDDDGERWEAKCQKTGVITEYWLIPGTELIGEPFGQSFTDTPSPGAARILDQ